MKTVTLNAFDLQEAVLIAERIHAIRSVARSKKERILTASAFEGDYMGAVGEVAVCRHFNIPHPRKIRLGGDGGSDLSINGWSVQVKCTKFTGPNPMMIMATKEMFVAQVGILTRMKSPTTIDIVGCVSRDKFMRLAKQKIFVDTPDWYVNADALVDADTITRFQAAA